MAQTSFFAQNFAQDSAGYTLMVLCTLLAFPAGFLLLARSEYPEATFWIACALVVVFPYDSLIALMAMTSLLARRSNRNTTIRATVGGTIVTLISQLRDAIAAEAHDTLAHSLSLMALNASALKAEAAKLGDSPEAQSLADKAEDIRRQSAGALDEAHSIIDMLRNPHQAWEQLAPSDDTSLTRESLDALIADTRNSGTSLNTWIDIQQLSVMDESIGKVAYRAIQEGLTNARRHAPGAPVSLEVSATPQAGVHIHISNPIATDATETQRAHGAGLPGLAARVHSVNGQCRYGMDDRHLFHVDVQLPWRS